MISADQTFLNSQKFIQQQQHMDLYHGATRLQILELIARALKETYSIFNLFIKLL